MNAITKKTALDTTRRGLMVGAALAGGALVVGCSPTDLLSMGAEKPESAFGPFLRIAADGSVTVVNKHQEMGQGNHAGLAAIVAEELDADWDKVKVEQSVANAKLYGNTLMNGIQGTGGSTAINNSWDQLRLAGASARGMLVQAAATRWSVPADQVTVKNGVVSHAASGRSAHFGELIADAAKVTPPQSPTLKQHKDFALIGSDRVRRKDSRAKSTGTQRYTQDVHLPNMLVAVISRPQPFGATVKSVDDSAARKVPGVVDVVQIPTGVAVLADTTYAAKKGREALKITWDTSKAELRSSDKILADYKTIAQGKGDAAIKPQVFQSAGDASNAFGGELFEATYDFPYLAHATMEPMNAVAIVDGMHVKIISGSQVQTLDQLNVAQAVGTLPGFVDIETLSAGGSFGRRANQTSDYIVDAARLAKHVGGKRPVKVVWTREDDMTAGRYRPLTHHSLAIKLDKDGFPAAWRHRVVSQSITKGMPMQKGLDESTVEGAKGSPYLKATPVVDGVVYMPESPVTVLWWRSVGATHAALVMEHTIDRLAKKAGKDPADYRRALYKKAGADRHLKVMELALEKAGWGQPLPAGTARGLAVHESFGSVVAQVAEVSLKDGKPRVGRVVAAVDCGTAISPNQIAAQMEGGVCYGLSAALYGKITLKDGVAQETNFDTYQVLRMDEAPHVETYILPSTAHPTGVGEPGTPVIAPAVANALLALNGTVTESLPLVKA
ncbi:xanthine dehydrogenase family protein molybdopterin-binding subunit [Phenylobacterium montanum]|uniref:Xanthine dehydrogenase family protein molybdopterin-binding subunit n=1 Tax=Phenylobacterium montanum TaxID=2823693 RepID=A0A975FVW6_9CAUL|nr:xanthine dehydrogenase family protein molybdopterin-binding subunit [Caulobacter sp. S6]QUD86254.1 xanthine dehydrogenase family protein molybdopterin-binding subunit [Caulobacter sp. S6]